MRRIIAIVSVIVVAVVLVFVATGAGNDDGGTYQVRAIFRNAFTVIPGEDVKIAGVVVGSIGALETASGGHKAAVVLNIEKPGFDDFRQDATCTIRPQSFIGERYVECTPTQPHPVGNNPSPELQQITSGPGKGQYLLPESSTVTPVDLDLVGNVMRLPFRERLTVILNEFGIGLGARGQDINRLIRDANPALRNLDKVLSILAKQNKTLADLAVDGDKSLAPLARDRRQLADYFKQASTVNEATASRSAAFQKNLELLPKFLAELTPTMNELKGFSDQFVPVLDQLGATAPSLNKLTENIAPFARASTPAFQSLGDAADAGSTALTASLPTAKKINTLSVALKPAATNLSALLTSLKDTGGIEQLMNVIYNGVASTNGYDTFGHYLRAQVGVDFCNQFQVTPGDPRCWANFYKQPSSSVRSVSTTRTSATESPQSSSSTPPATTGEDAKPLKLPSGLLPDARDRGTTSKPSTKPSKPQTSSSDPAEPLLDYLLGGD